MELLCSAPNCSNVARKRGKCVRHGGGKQCKVEDCKTHARKDGYCCRHAKAEGTLVETFLHQDVDDVKLSDLDLTSLFEEIDLENVIAPQLASSDSDIDSRLLDEYLMDISLFVVEI
ncbi:Aste57867_3230 [Aphanomyces stellatus]|uniref:Aste57867_3230 protein n=1 Tax=Aphanomyces stellatus TaxID=120398 RepID=A0A485KD30_9STRA|nr:hypothetical protein As57867_003220 [Aphanomyces stellatus]VFT80404.1 Aste57867_3230 [Aphanomyces stellatus]